MDYWEILEGLSKLLLMPEFKDKNDIWILSRGEIKILYSDLYKLKDTAAELYPKDSRATKTAIVAEPGIQQSLAILYSDISKDLPREIRVFSDLKSAEDWIKINS